MSEGDYNSNSVDATLARIEANLKTALDALVDQNRRLSVLETAENKRAGALAMVGMVSGVIATGATLLVQHFRK